MKVGARQAPERPRNSYPPILEIPIPYPLLTKDTDRLHAFYREVFGATVFHDQVDGDLRLSLVDIGPGTRLNVFEIRGNTEAERQVPMFGRGRLDHIGLEAASKEAFDTHPSALDGAGR